MIGMGNYQKTISLRETYCDVAGFVIGMERVIEVLTEKIIENGLRFLKRYLRLRQIGNRFFLVLFAFHAYLVLAFSLRALCHAFRILCFSMIGENPASGHGGGLRVEKKRTTPDLEDTTQNRIGTTKQKRGFAEHRVQSEREEYSVSFLFRRI